MNAPTVCARCQNQCGESPIWDPSTRLLSWVDTENPLFSTLDPATFAVATVKPPWLVQAIGRRKGGGWIAVVRDGFALLEIDASKGTFLGNPVEGKAHMTMNDGAVGPDGRFYAGSLNVDVLDAPDGRLHRVDADGSMSTIESGLVLPNGISFSPDGRTLYVTEMWVNKITAFDFDAVGGTVSHRRVLVRVPDEEGHPDGLIVDAEGFLWSGHWQGFRVTRYDPDGRKVSHVDLPVPTATCMAFIGPELDQLCITSAKKGLSPEQLESHPVSGDLFMVKTGIRGRIEPVFGA